MEKKEQLYEGKAKKVFATENPDYCIVSYKDDATAFNGLKKGTILGKGAINNRVTNYLMKMLEKEGIPTHFVEELNDRETVVGRTVLEFCYKDDALGDPMVNEYHILAMNFATEEELKLISEYSLKINRILSEYLAEVNVELIDFKLEFGKTADGTVVLADEISPDTCRFWDMTTHEKLDKDRFRRDLGGVEDAYHEILKRLLGE